MGAPEVPVALASEIGSQEGCGDGDAAAARLAQGNFERRRRRAHWILAGSAFAFLAFAVGIALVVERRSFNASIEALNRRLTDEELPTTWEGVRAAAPHPPADLDGTAEWEAVLKKHGRIPFLSLYESPGEPPIEEQFAKAEAHSAAWRSDLRRLADSGTYCATKYDRAWLTDLDYLYHSDPYACQTDYCRYLEKRAKYLRSIGDADGAAESLYLHLAVLKNSKYEPFVHSLGDYGLTQACDEIEALLAGHELSAERWRQLQESLERCELSASCASTALHEVIFLRDLAAESDGLGFADLNMLDERVARHLMAARLELNDGYRRGLELPPTERLEAMHRLDVEKDRLNANVGPLMTESAVEFVRDDCSVYPTNMYHGFLHVELFRSVAETRRRTLVAAIACRRFELERSRMPSDWSGLADFGVKEPPKNPWTNDSMKLSPNSDGSVSIETPWPDEAIRRHETIPPSRSMPVERFEGMTVPSRR